MSPRTIFLSRLIGLYCIFIALSMLTRKQATLETINAMFQNPPMLLMVGVIALGVGLAMVLTHNIWWGGSLAVIVTVIGWLTLIKGLMFLFLPAELEAGVVLRQLHFQNLFTLYVDILLALGIYLTYAGFRARSR